jgi:hypothetical protein
MDGDGWIHGMGKFGENRVHSMFCRGHAFLEADIIGEKRIRCLGSDQKM